MGSLRANRRALGLPSSNYLPVRLHKMSYNTSNHKQQKPDSYTKSMQDCSFIKTMIIDLAA